MYAALSAGRQSSPIGVHLHSRCRQPALAVPVRQHHRCRLRLPQVTQAAALARPVPEDGDPAKQYQGSERAAVRGGFGAFFTALSDPACNRKLLAISLAQMLSSISTLIHDTYMPLYMSEVLHMSSTKMGNLYGVLQLVSRASGVASGRLADTFTPARMVILGVGLTAFASKPMLAVCGSVCAVAGAAACVTWVTYAKMFDRIVKGIREAPSKALVGELAAQSGDPAAGAFSVRHSLSTLGMLLGSGAAATAFQLTGRSYQATFALSIIPAVAGLILVVAAFGSDAVAGRTQGIQSGTSEPATLSLLAKARAFSSALPGGYYQALIVAFTLYLARFDVAFITVHASSVMDRASLPMLTLFSMLPVVVLAAPIGMWAKAGVAARNRVLVAGTGMLILGDLCYGLMHSMLGMVLGSVCVGLHLAATQGVLYGMLASYIPSQPVAGVGRMSGTAWSFTDLLLGVSLAYSNSLAGYLCDWTAARGLGSSGCFFGGAAFSVLAIAALLCFSAYGELGREEPVLAPQKP